MRVRVRVCISVHIHVDTDIDTDVGIDLDMDLDLAHMHMQVARYKEVLEVGDNARLFRAVFPDLVQGAAGADVEPAASAQLASNATASFRPAMPPHC